MSKRFGRGKGPSKEDIEREAEREVARLQQQVGARPPGPPPEGPGGGGAPGPFGGPGGPGGPFRSPLEDVAASARGRSVRRGESPSPVDPGYGPMASGRVGGTGPGIGPFGGGGPYGGGGPFVGGGPAAQGTFGGPGRPPSIEVPEWDDPDEESASVTELALRDLAGRHGANPEDLVIRTDPAMAEAMRDEAMRRFMDRQQAQRTQATVTKLDPSQTVLGRLAARRQAREEGREPDPEPEPTGGGLLGRLQIQQEQQDEEGLSPLERRARELARRREEMQHTSGQVFAMPTAEPQDTGSPELAQMAARLTARAKPRGRPPAPAAEAAPPAQAPARKATAKKAPTAKAASTKPPARAAAKKATANKAAAAKATAKKATAKKAAGKKAVATKATRKATAKKVAAAKGTSKGRAVKKRR